MNGPNDMSHTHSQASHAPHADSHGHGSVHVVPMKVLIATLLALLVLTVVTVGAAGHPILKTSGLGIWVAMGVATVKAGIVMLYFMHLRYDSKFNTFAIISAVLFVGLFIFMCYLDSGEYRPNVDKLEKTFKVKGP